MSEVLAAGTEITVTIRLKLPKAADEAAVTEWLRFALNDNGSMQASNPLAGDIVEPIFPHGFDWRM